MMGSFEPRVPPVQNQRHRDYQRQRQVTITDLLLENRIVFLGTTPYGLMPHTHVTDVMANATIQELLFLQYENRTQEIHFYINSPGGDVTAMLAIYDTMQFLECPISTYCVGEASSAAAVLLTAGTRGKRYALPHARVMIHEPWHPGFGGQASDVEIFMNELLNHREAVLKILAKHTGRSIDELKVVTERNRFFSAEEAKAFGLVDEVLEKSKEKPKA